MDRKQKLLRLVLWGVIVLIAAGSVLMLLLKHREEGAAADLLPSMTSEDVVYDNADAYTVGGAELDAEDIRCVRLNWLTGRVVLRAAADGKIRFSEDYSGEEQYRLRYRADGGELSIEPCRSGAVQLPEKTLTLELPADCLSELSLSLTSAELDAEQVAVEQLSVSGVSGSLELNNIRAETLTLDTVSGAVSGEGLDAWELRLGSVSGGVRLSGSFPRSSIETTSGSVELSCVQTPEALDIATVSGSVTLRLPGDAAFGYHFSTVSGSVASTLPGASERTDAAVRVETTSGSLTLEARD